MARTRIEALRTPTQVLSWLRRSRHEGLSPIEVLSAIRSIYGVVPLGGRVGGVDGATPRATPNPSALTIISGNERGQISGKSSSTLNDEELWQFLLSSVQLPMSGDQQGLRKALESLQDQRKLRMPQDIEALKCHYFLERRAFFAVRLELFRIAQKPQHLHAQAAKEIVNELLKEGLRETLLDEVYGRQFVRPPRFGGVGAAERQALQAWGVQFLEEEALSRELLLLTLVESSEKTTIARALEMVKTIHNWDDSVLDMVFSTSRNVVLEVQEKARRLTYVGLVLALQLLQTSEAGQEFNTLRLETTDFFLAEWGQDSELNDVISPVPGVLLLAWTALLGRYYNQIESSASNIEQRNELQQLLQQTLSAAERRQSFQCLNALLHSLVSHFENAEDSSAALLHPLSLHVKKVWEMPTVATATGSRRHKTNFAHYPTCYDRIRRFQHVMANFLNDMLSTLGFMEQLTQASQIHAMVQFVLPVLLNARVAKKVLGIDVQDDEMMNIAISEDGSALKDLWTKTRALLPESLLSNMEMGAALCCQYQDVSSSAVLRQVLKHFKSPCLNGMEGLEIMHRLCRPVPPAEYFRNIAGNSGRVECVHSFAYNEAGGQVVVPVGTFGVIMPNGEEEQVEWKIIDEEHQKMFSLWDLLIIRANRLMKGLQSMSLGDICRYHTDDVGVVTAFFHFITQIGHQQDGGQVMLEEMQRQWGEARLRQWWKEWQLPFPEKYLPELMRQHVALPTLLSASSENLVSWGIWDRQVRERILALCGQTQQCNNSDMSSTDALARDGSTQLLRLVLQVLGSFLRTTLGTSDDGENKTYLSFVNASLLTLQTLLATSFGVSVLVTSLRQIERDESVEVIIQSAKKIFEVNERLYGVYSVVLATQEIIMSVVRWFLANEAQALADAPFDNVQSPAFVAMERLWFVSAADFAIQVLLTQESWKFASGRERCEILERCYRLLYVLVSPRKCLSEQNEIIPAFEAALRETLATDMLLLNNLLHSCSVALPLMQATHWNSAMLSRSRNDALSKAENYSSLMHESVIDGVEVDRAQLESLVTTCLQIVKVLLANEDFRKDVEAARMILLTPIDGPTKRNSLTLVTLCGLYLEYDADESPGLAYWSLQILQRAAVVLDSRSARASDDVSLMHSLVHGDEDITRLRSIFAHQLRDSSPQQSTVRTNMMDMLTLCLRHQPSFLALLLFGSKSGHNELEKEKFEENLLPIAAMLEGFVETSEKQLERSSDFFCALLTFLVHVWEGANNRRSGLHFQIMNALRKSDAFWPNVTQALKVHMPLDSMEERGTLDLELAAATAQSKGDVENRSISYVGRSSAYGYLARGLILHLVSCEWHNRAKRQSDHPLVNVLKSFEKEGLYSYWLRTFTRLDYSPTQLKQHATSIRRACIGKRPARDLLDDLPVERTSMYYEGIICDANTLKWQLSKNGTFKQQTRSVDIRAFKLVQWSNSQAAYLHAQLYSLAKWKAFMELCCLRNGVTGDTENTSAPVQLKRPELIYSSPRIMNNVSNGMSTSIALNSVDLLSDSRFIDDRTIFGMIQMLVNVIEIRVKRFDTQDKTLDYFMLIYFRDLTQLLISMLHHQLCIATTIEMKSFQTRQHSEMSSTDSDLQLDANTTLDVLAVIEKMMCLVHASIKQETRDLQISSGNSTLSDKLTVVPLLCRIITNFASKVDIVATDMHASLFIVTLLLVRHWRKLSTQTTGFDDNVSPFKPLLQAKLIGHCKAVIDLYHERKHFEQSVQSLYQLSCCLFQEILSSCGFADSHKSPLSMGIVTSPLFKKLEHELEGLDTFFHLLVQQLRLGSFEKEDIARHEAVYHVLQGLTAVVWDPANGELCRHVMLHNIKSRPSTGLLTILAIELLPVLQDQMKREATNSKLRGYVKSGTDKLQRSMAHRMWCLVLNFVSGLLCMSTRLDVAYVWVFMSHAEPLLLAAIEPGNCSRLTRAIVAEHQAYLRFLYGLSKTAVTRRSWRQAFPKNFVVLMEQSRHLLRRACVLLSTLSFEKSRLCKEKSQKQHSRGSGKAGVKLPKSPRSPSSFPLVHEDLLHDQLQAVDAKDKQEVTQFRRAMEAELVEIVRISSLMLVKWTASITDRDAILVVNGVRYVDEEQLVPLLSFDPPSEARSMDSSPSLGHLGLAMKFIFDELLMGNEMTSTTPKKGKEVMENAMDACALLFLKTYMLHLEQYELADRDCKEFKTLFSQLCARLCSVENVGFDKDLLNHIGKV
ncbi:hypothetical protein CCR75_007314 [Bremia lactucae]|uniref:Uncharacterized protein n=1 Tax=Bremia lactucae TaxID=4779 RepID=A0A976FIC8_BRELC|nr:hypothetical protein CCR75_007314 [Bremia lactucae]